MRKFHFAIAAAALLGLAACGRQDDTSGENVEAYDNQAELDYLADNAVSDAEIQALGNQEQQLEAEEQAQDVDAGNDVATEPSDVEDDVQGM